MKRMGSRVQLRKDKRWLVNHAPVLAVDHDINVAVTGDGAGVGYRAYDEVRYPDGPDPTRIVVSLD